MTSQYLISEGNPSAKSLFADKLRSTTRAQWCLLGILLAACLCYTWSLDANGWANAYYSAAVQAGLHDPVSYFFGAADWGNSMSVDKPPLSLWIMGASAKIFGLNTWALILPQALMTVISTLLVFKIAKRSGSSAMALIASTVFAFTPITVLLARYNNPDPLMILLMLTAFHSALLATEHKRLGLLWLSAGLLTLGFLTKQLQAFLVLPAILTMFLLFAPYSWSRKAKLGGLATLLLGAGSMAWPLIVDLTAPGSRPYVGGSKGNSMFELVLGYNGMNRVVQHEQDPTAALLPPELRSVDSDAGFFRLWNVNYGQEIGWLLLPALVACIAITVRLIRRHYPRGEAIVAAGSVVWMTTTYMLLSFMGNSFHSYYTASLAAPMALCLGLGAQLLFAGDTSRTRRLLLAATLIAAAIFGKAMWQISDDFPGWLGTCLLLVTLSAATLVLVQAPKPWITQVAAWSAVASLLAGPIFCSLLTLKSPQQGSNPLSGGVSRNEHSLSRFLAGIKNGEPAWVAGLAIGNDPGPELTKVLHNSPDSCTWAAATYPGQTAARFQLASDRPVMALGGFAATDPSPTLEQFRELVSAGRICFLVPQPDQLKVPGTSDDVLAVTRWVESSFKPEKVNGVIVYRLVGTSG
ncbi:glycosyl transferase family 39 [Pseudarthrobacter chlorophenolicus A6]|uniref:Glycosyl transferase family 39 n=1 Tax=Pseudarthrobacter chlorophenolicus (strain ATCC 700700 / DSM 12829 / CIP 107037 / JCM 12360 / KCTC 9906 / NCIMB 13794 / A6) TaxID=452863 RepID=B8HCH8_PSECP|nr:glycosyltransferase family 39 protein [Pseudarthrobacter chlorophenolicus]ACL40594.1 glycosyl transferase family 39 [Pseudarthrobacter chlorophenolicus A6]SDQ78672.1 4-amino-4-deoxy-L-arabinose transferase [Pseudarthrobacter chlorophenolicus]